MLFSHLNLKWDRRKLLPISAFIIFAINLFIHSFLYSTNRYGVIYVCQGWMFSLIFDFWSVRLSWFIHFLFLGIIYFLDFFLCSSNVVMVHLRISARVNIWITFLLWYCLPMLPWLLIPTLFTFQPSIPQNLTCL